MTNMVAAWVTSVWRATGRVPPGDPTSSDTREPTGGTANMFAALAGGPRRLDLALERRRARADRHAPGPKRRTCSSLPRHVARFGGSMAGGGEHVRRPIGLDLSCVRGRLRARGATCPAARDLAYERATACSAARRPALGFPCCAKARNMFGGGRSVRDDGEHARRSRAAAHVYDGDKHVQRPVACQ